MYFLAALVLVCVDVVVRTHMEHINECSTSIKLKYVLRLPSSIRQKKLFDIFSMASWKVIWNRF